MRWIQVSKQKPKVGVPVITYQENKKFPQFRQMILGWDGKFFRDFETDEACDYLLEKGASYNSITHWMYLPKAPNKQPL